YRVGDSRQRMRLDAQDDVVLRSRLARVVSAMRTHDVRLAFADQLQAALAHGGEMRPARDEGHVVAGERELRAHEPADRSRSEDADLHPPRPSFAARPMRCNLPVRPFGISRTKKNLRGTFHCSSRCAANSRSSRSVQVFPSRSTTAAAMSSPSLSCGTANVTH